MFRCCGKLRQRGNQAGNTVTVIYFNPGEYGNMTIRLTSKYWRLQLVKMSRTVMKPLSALACRAVNSFLVLLLLETDKKSGNDKQRNE